MLIIVGTAKLLTSLDTGVVIILLYFSSDDIFCRMGLSTFGICTCLKLIQSNITLKTVVVKTTKLAMLVGAAFGHPVLSKVLIRNKVTENRPLSPLVCRPLLPYLVSLSIILIISSIF
jgi:hypothetical protein